MTWPMFVQRVQLQLCITALVVYSEPANTPGHAVRAARSTAVLNNISQYVASYVQTVVAQLDLSATNIVNNNTDLDTTDAAIATAIKAKWNALAGA